MEKLWLQSDSWSRGLLLGRTSMAAPAEVAIDDQGVVYGVLFPRSPEDEKLYQPQLITLDKTGALVQITALDFQIALPRQAKLFLSREGIDLFWIEKYQVMAVQLSYEGDLISDISNLSGENFANNFDVIPTENGYQLWYAGRRDDPGIYALTGSLDNLNETLVDPEGIQVNLFLDTENQLHSSWARYPVTYGDLKYYYLSTDLNNPDLPDPVVVFSKSISPAIRVDGPSLVVDSEVVYLIWNEVIVTGLDAGSQTAYYRYFPLGYPEDVRPSFRLYVPAVQNISGVAYPYGDFQTGERIIVSQGIPSSPFIENVGTITEQFSEMPIVFRSKSEFKWRDQRYQANIGYLSDGLLTTYQPLSYTSAESYHPFVINDPNGNLFVTWLEKGDTTYAVYLTTTDPLKKAQIDLVSNEDYLYLAAEGIFGMLAGAVLSPFAAAAWGGAGLLAFLVNLIFARFNKRIYQMIGEIVSIVGGIMIFWWIKMATLPGLRGGDYIPFSAWIPRIPANLQQPLIIGIPPLIGLVALAIAYFYTYGKKSGSAINFFLIYSAVDTLLSCAIYGILIYGSF